MQLRDHTRTLVQISMLAAILTILSLIAVPLPAGVPLTLQTFAVALCGFLGGVRKGTAAAAVYLLLGAVGLPVFSGFRGGFGVLLDLTGGFLWGFLPLAFCYGIAAKPLCKNTFCNHGLAFLLGACGLLLCHILGILQYMALCHVPLTAAAAAVSLPFFGKDLFLIAAARAVASAAEKAMRTNGIALNK